MVEKLLGELYWDELPDAVGQVCVYHNLKGNFFNFDKVTDYAFVRSYLKFLLKEDGETQWPSWPSMYPSGGDKNANDLIDFLQKNLSNIKECILLDIEEAIVYDTMSICYKGTYRSFINKPGLLPDQRLLLKAQQEVTNLSGECNVQNLFNRYVEIIKQNSERE